MSDGVRYGLALLIPLLVTVVVTPMFGRLARRLGILDRPTDHKTHRVATPYLGGIAVAAGLAGVGLALGGASGQLTVLLLGAAAVAGLGLVDDWRTVGPGTKIVVESGAALALWFAGIRAGLFGNEVLDALLTVVWVVTVTNAFNLVDNMDGLASGLAAISAFAFFGIAADEGFVLVASLALATTGASLGFLWHNFPPAKIFLGDAGSLLLGFLLAALGLQLDLIGETGLVRSVIPILIVAVPLFDMGLVIVARLIGGRHFYDGGTDHSSHRLLGLGLSPRAVAFVAYAVQVVCCAVALVLRASGWGAVAAVSLASAVIALIALGLMLRTAPLVPAEAEADPSEAAATQGS